MSKTFFTADTHFGHTNIIKMCNRPFENIEEHDYALIDAWNAVVGPDDTVYHLGDFAHKASPKWTRRVFEKLNGTKHLVLGNHDFRGGTRGLPWASQAHIVDVTVEGTRLVLCHYGMRVWPAMRHGTLQLYGHSHGKLPGNRMSCDVGVDDWNYMPVDLPKIRARLETLPQIVFRDDTDETDDDNGVPTP